MQNPKGNAVYKRPAEESQKYLNVGCGPTMGPEHLIRYLIDFPKMSYPKSSFS